MIVVDTSVWIDFLNGHDVPHVRRLDAMLGTGEIVVGDLVLCEVLQGLESERKAQEVEARLRPFAQCFVVWSFKALHVGNERPQIIGRKIDRALGGDHPARGAIESLRDIRDGKVRVGMKHIWIDNHELQ